MVMSHSPVVVGGVTGTLTALCSVIPAAVTVIDEPSKSHSTVRQVPVSWSISEEVRLLCTAVTTAALDEARWQM